MAMLKLSRLALMLAAAGVASVFLHIRSSQVATGPAAAATTSAIGFETPTPVDPIHTFGEPDTGVHSQGPDGGEQWNKSLDGLTYTDATNADQEGAALVTTSTEPTYSPFGGDGYPAIDQVTGKVFQTAGFQNDDGTYDLLLNIGTPDAAG